MIIFRVDSSAQIGSGHMMRCLTLAGQLKDRGTDIAFISRNLEGNLNYLIEKQGYKLFQLPRAMLNDELTGYEAWLTVKLTVDAEQTKEILHKLTVDWLIVDSYAIDEHWEKTVRSHTKKIMVIDDLANRRHDCDVLLDQNYYDDKDSRYNSLVPADCKLFLGPQYVLLRKEFYEADKNIRIRSGHVHNIFIFFGGSDLTNETMKTLQALSDLDVTINAVVGNSNTEREKVRLYCRRHEDIHYFCQTNNIALLMSKADLAIGAGGSSTWERCFLGLPSIVIATAENQVKISRDCDELGIIKYIGNAQNVTQEDIKKAVELMMKDQELIKRMVGKMRTVFSKMASNSIVDEVFK